MTNKTKNKLAKSIQDDILAIEQFLELIEEPHAFENAKIKKTADSLTRLLPKMKAEISVLSDESDTTENLNNSLEEDCRALKDETKNLNRSVREKNKELQKLKEAPKKLKDPETKKKLKDFGLLKKEVLTLEESVDGKNKHLAELQEKHQAFKELKEDLARHTDAVADEKNKISQLEQEARQCEARLEELTTIESQKLQDLHDHQLLKSLRLALKAKHEDLQPPLWAKLVEVLDFENE